MPRKSQSEVSAAALRAQLGYIDERQLFSLLRIKAGQGRNRQSEGSLPPCYKIGREKLYRLTEVQEWIQRRRVARSAPSDRREVAA